VFGNKIRVVFIVFAISLLDEVVGPVCPNQRRERIQIAQDAILVGAKGGILYCIVFIHRSSNPYKAHTYRILNLSYIETIMENYEL